MGAATAAADTSRLPPRHSLERPDICSRIVAGEARKRAINETRMTREKRFCSQTQPSHYARPEVFDQNVGVLCESQRLRRAGRTLQVEHNAAFASLQNRVRRMIPKLAAGRVDPNHVRPMIGEHHGDQRACQILTEIQHPDSFKRTHGGLSLSFFQRLTVQAEYC